MAQEGDRLSGSYSAPDKPLTAPDKPLTSELLNGASKRQWLNHHRQANWALLLLDKRQVYEKHTYVQSIYFSLVECSGKKDNVFLMGSTVCSPRGRKGG